MQLVGLTRNKILSDLKASGGVKGHGLKVPTSYARLHVRDDIWTIAGHYLAKRLRSVLGPICEAGGDVKFILESLNQATWPGWIRQERAKRQGHEAEYRLATILASGSIPFEPKEKAHNPLSRDATIHGVSFDLVVGSTEHPLVCVKSTVHTANIGQYGESKDALEIREARDVIDARFPGAFRPTLLALIDGVGFFSNRAGLDGVLSSADEFCQFRTIWKAVVVACSRLGRHVVVALPEDEISCHSDFIADHRGVVAVEILSETHRARLGGPAVVEAGDAILIL